MAEAAIGCPALVARKTGPLRRSDGPARQTLAALRWLIAMADERLFCSFCQRSNEDLGHLLAGPGVAVCDDCLAHLSTTMAKLRPEWGAALAERITTLGKMGH